MVERDWGTLRAYLPAVAGWVGALALQLGLEHGPLDYLPAAWRWALCWLPLALATLALGHGGWVSWQLWQARRGHGLLCFACDGPLGMERHGHWGPYRRCRCCGRNIARRHYEYLA